MSDLPARLRGRRRRSPTGDLRRRDEARGAEGLELPERGLGFLRIAAVVVVLIAIGSAVLVVALDRDDDPAGTARAAEAGRRRRPRRGRS